MYKTRNTKNMRFFCCYDYIYVQRKVRIGPIPELYLRNVRIPTLSVDSGILPCNSRIAQGVFNRLHKSKNWLDKVRIG